MKKIYLLLIFFGILSGLTYGQDQRTLQTRVADILTEMPARSNERMNQLMQEMSELPVEALDRMATRVSQQDGNSEGPVRYALTSYARYIGQKNPSEKTEKFNALLLSHAHTAKMAEQKNFFLLLCRYTMEVRNLNALEKFAFEPETRGTALMLLTEVGGESAIAVLKKLYAEDPLQADVVQAFHAMENYTLVTEVMNTLEQNPLPNQLELHITGNQYLSNAGSEQAWDYLRKAATATSFKLEFDPSQSLTAVANLATVAFRQGNNRLGAEIKTFILDNYKDPGTQHFRISVLRAALQANSSLVTGKWMDKELKTAAPSYYNELLQLAQHTEIPVNEKKLLKTYKTSVVEVRTGIVGYAVAQRNISLLNQLKAITQPTIQYPHRDLWVGKAILEGEEALAEILRAAKEPYLTEAAITGLNILLHPGTVNESLDLVMKESFPPESLSPLILNLAQKSTPEEFTRFLSFTKSNSESVQESAYQSLRYVSDQSHFDRLSEIYEAAPEYFKPLVIDALEVSLSDFSSREDQVAQVRQFLDNENYDAFFRFSPMVGGKELAADVYAWTNHSTLGSQSKQALLAWSDPSTVPYLLSFIRSDDTHSAEASEMFSRAIALSGLPSLPADQKLLYLRTLMDLSVSKGQREQIIRQMATIKTFPAFAYLYPWLKNTEYRSLVSRALMNMALPDPSQEYGLYGDRVREGLEEVMEVLEGLEATYAKEDIKVYLDKMPAGEGYIPMFNGKDLSGWKGFVANPIQLAKMSDREKNSKQKEADEKLKENWGTQEGMITFSGKGENLVSAKDYGDFEMYVDWKITRNGDSGIYLRGTPQVQIWDTSRVEVGAQVGSGGLYNNQKHPSKPPVVADNPVGEWNTFYIRMIGEKVTVKLNGITVVDEVTLENYWDRNLPIFPTGPIELQAHGTDLAFRDIYIREISSPDFSVTPEEKREGFISLFNGNNLDGWMGNKDDYSAASGRIVIDPQGGGRGNLYTEKQYDNFVFRFEFQLTPGANNGLGIHTPPEGDAAYVGKEIQILDNTASIYSNLEKWQYHGSVYGVMAAKRGFLKPVGEWNSEEVIVQGNTIKIILNGEVIVEGNYVEASKNGTLDGKVHPGIQRKKGHIGFLGHGSVVRFRNIRIKEL